MENRAYERLILEYQDGTLVVTTHIQQEIYPELWKTYVMRYKMRSNHRFWSNRTSARHPSVHATGFELFEHQIHYQTISVDIAAEPKLMATPVPPKSSISDSTVISTEGLNGWPDSNFEQDFSWQEVEETSNLSVYRAVRVDVGDRRGDKQAESWQKGKKLYMGITECDNATFNLIAQPPSSRSRLLLCWL